MYFLNKETNCEVQKQTYGMLASLPSSAVALGLCPSQTLRCQWVLVSPCVYQVALDNSHTYSVHMISGYQNQHTVG